MLGAAPPVVESSCIIGLFFLARRLCRNHQTAPTRSTSRTPATTPTAIAIVRVFVLLLLEALCGGTEVLVEVLDVEVREIDAVGVVFPAIAMMVGTPRSCFSTVVELQQSFSREQQYSPEPQYQTASSPMGQSAGHQHGLLELVGAICLTYSLYTPHCNFLQSPGSYMLP